MIDSESLVSKYSSILGKIIDNEELFCEHFPAHIYNAIMATKKTITDRSKLRKLEELAVSIYPGDELCKSLAELENEGFDEAVFYNELKEVLQGK